MKKLLLLTLLLSIGFIGISQDRIVIPKSTRDISKEAVFINPTDEIVDVNVAPNLYVSQSKDFEGEDIIGTTYYDLQTNAMLGNRIHAYPDGSIGTVWSRGVDAAPDFPDRGTGYNFFDSGMYWMDEPTSRVEDERTGWPSYAPLGENGEIIVAHLASGLKISTREQKGEGDWSFQTLTGPTDISWPRVITSGEDNNIIHILVNSYDPYEGQPRALLYYRSQDAGLTWDIEAEVLEGTGLDYYTEINADTYVWAEENGGTIAFLVGSAWTDLFMMKSTDNGDNWDKTVIWEHPYPFFDWETTVTDTFYCVDNSASITLDYNGMAHVVFGINRVIHNDVGTTYNFFPFVDGIGYWNEEMNTFSDNLNALSPYSDDPGTELVEDFNLVGWTQDVNGNGEIDFITWDPELFQSYREFGVSTMPNITIDDQDAMVILFSSTTESFDNGVTNFKHIWVRINGPDGNWSDFRDINSSPAHMFDECIFPTSTYNQECFVHFLYQADFSPGLAFDEDHTCEENRIFVATYDFCVGINENTVEVPEIIISQNTPNPAYNTTSISVESEEKGIMNLIVSNILGQVVYQESNENSSNEHTFNLVVSNLDPGVYFYTVEMGNGSVTKKMIVK